jgi:hypothetical protein
VRHMLNIRAPVEEAIDLKPIAENFDLERARHRVVPHKSDGAPIPFRDFRNGAPGPHETHQVRDLSDGVRIKRFAAARNDALDLGLDVRPVTHNVSYASSSVLPRNIPRLGRLPVLGEATTFSKVSDAYESDYYAWTQTQAEILRRLKTADNQLDREHIAEEIEDLGRSERFACEAFVERIIEHLLKLDFSGLAEPSGHWRKELRNFRYELARRMTPSIERLLRESLASRYAKGRADASDLDEEIAGFSRRLPEECPYSFEQITSEWLPSSRE